MLLTRANTDALNTVSDLTRGQHTLEAEVLAHKSGLFEDQLQPRRAALADRDRLLSTINSNASVLQQLHTRREALRRKATQLFDQ
jgi:hypothetical protein